MTGPKKQHNDKNLKLKIHRAVKSLIKDKEKEKVTAVKFLPFLSEKVSLRTLQKSMKADKDLSY